jgi:hypothetical protein
MPLDARTVSCSAVRSIELELGIGPDVAVIDTIDCGGQLFDWATVDLDAEASITRCAQVTS